MLANREYIFKKDASCFWQFAPGVYASIAEKFIHRFSDAFSATDMFYFNTKG